MATTLTATKILALTLASFRKKTPQLAAFATDFRSDTLRLGEQAIAHIPTLPTVGTFDNTTGYRNGSQAARSLMVDVPVTVDMHRHVTISWDHINNISDQKDSVEQMVSNAAYVLGKAVLDSVLAKVLATNISRVVQLPWADVDRTTLRDARKKMNLAGAAEEGRVIIGNSDFCGQFGEDPRISSREFSGQADEANAYSHFTNVEGFSHIWEYPDLPVNGENLMAFACDPRAVAIRAGVPDNTFDLARQLGIQTVGSGEVMTDTGSGLSLLAINWQDPATFNLNLTLAMVWGSAVGKQAGSNNTICDNAGLRFVNAATP